MGLCNYWGFGVPKNTKAGGNFIHLASTTSSNELTELATGICYFGGFGVKADMAKAFSIF